MIALRQQGPRRLRDVSGVGYLVPPTKNPGDALTSALWNSYIRDNLDFGMVRPIADIILGAPAAAIDFTSIPATFAHLLVVIYGRSDDVSLNKPCNLRFNNDSGTNYDLQQVLANAAAASGVEGFAATFTQLGSVPAANAPANVFGQVEALIPHYAGVANNKVARSSWALKYGTTTGTLVAGMGSTFWRSSAAINRVTVFPFAGNFIAGSRGTLYGMGGI